MQVIGINLNTLISYYAMPVPADKKSTNISIMCGDDSIADR